MNVPAGISDGMRIRMAGQGEVGPGGGPSGDLYVEVQMDTHPVYQREGDDLHLDVSVPMVDAALGTDFEVDDLLGNPMTLTVDPGTQPEQEIRVEGKGMPHLRGEGNGDLIAHVGVSVPTKLDRRSRELLEELRDHRGDDAKVSDAADHRGFFSRFRRR